MGCPPRIIFSDSAFFLIARHFAGSQARKMNWIEMEACRGERCLDGKSHMLHIPT